MNFDRSHPFNPYWIAEFKPNEDFPYPWEFNDLSFVCIEQYLQMCKAILFEDVTKQRLYAYCRLPVDFKRLSTSVSGFRKTTWIKHRGRFMYWGNRFKFHQHEDLKQLLLDTGDEELFFENQYDRTWGVVNGVGLNLLGYSLMRVRLGMVHKPQSEAYQALKREYRMLEEAQARKNGWVNPLELSE